MNKMTINGVEFCDFGTCYGSCGMHCITAMPENLAQFIQDVLNGQYPGVFLNPSCDCSYGEEFFGVWGTPEQYKEFHKAQVDATIASRVIARYGGISRFIRETNYDPEGHEAITAEITNAYKDWWQ